MQGFNSPTLTTRFNSKRHGATSSFRNWNGFFVN